MKPHREIDMTKEGEPGIKPKLLPWRIAITAVGIAIGASGAQRDWRVTYEHIIEHIRGNIEGIDVSASEVYPKQVSNR